MLLLAASVHFKIALTSQAGGSGSGGGNLPPNQEEINAEFEAALEADLDADFTLICDYWDLTKRMVYT